jgi:hypothetical protein
MNSNPLADLDPDFGPIDGAKALMFDCPACDRSHSIAVTFEPPSLFPSGALWKCTDDNPDTFTVTPSINCDHGHGCTFHGFVTKGVVTW